MKTRLLVTIVVLIAVISSGTTFAADYDYTKLPANLKVRYLQKKAKDIAVAKTWLETTIDSLELIKAKDEVKSELEQAKKEMEKQWDAEVLPLSMDDCFKWVDGEITKANWFAERHHLEIEFADDDDADTITDKFKNALKKRNDFRREVTTLVNKKIASLKIGYDGIARNLADTAWNYADATMDSTNSMKVQIADIMDRLNSIENRTDDLEDRISELEVAGYSAKKADRKAARDRIKANLK
ncbi:MAG: hypothetical protein ABIA91_00785 [Patescibacteria group bacterium]